MYLSHIGMPDSNEYIHFTQNQENWSMQHLFESPRSNSDPSNGESTQDNCLLGMLDMEKHK